MNRSPMKNSPRKSPYKNSPRKGTPTKSSPLKGSPARSSPRKASRVVKKKTAEELIDELYDQIERLEYDNQALQRKVEFLEDMIEELKN